MGFAFPKQFHVMFEVFWFKRCWIFCIQGLTYKFHQTDTVKTSWVWIRCVQHFTPVKRKTRFVTIFCFTHFFSLCFTQWASITFLSIPAKYQWNKGSKHTKKGHFENKQLCKIMKTSWHTFLHAFFPLCKLTLNMEVIQKLIPRKHYEGMCSLLKLKGHIKIIILLYT